jgi:superfamily II DNA or RNA helicase
MRAKIENHEIIISDPTDTFRRYLRDHLSYTDKSKEYQIRKMEKNPYTRGSVQLKKMKAEMSGNLLVENQDGSLTIPSGFSHLVEKIDVDDLRKDTGITITLPWVNKPHDPRDYQLEAIELMENNYRGLINFATGLGKTLTAIHLTRKMKKRTLIICPGKTIADNFYAELIQAFGESRVGYFGNGKKQIKDITVGIVQSVNNSIDRFIQQDLGLVIFDEVHHLAATTFFSIAEGLKNVGRMFGLTATDFRSDGKDIMITAGVGKVLIKRDLIWGIEHKWLADPYFIVRGIDTVGKEYKDDKLKNYREHVMNCKAMNDRIVNDVQKFLAAGMSVLCLVDQIDHGDAVAKAVGLPFATGEDKMSKDYVDQLNAGSIPGLIGTDSMIGEGCDTKRVDVLVLANFVASKGPLWQNIGRGMRLYGTKTQVIILDYCPKGSSMLTRHCKQRIALYKEITSNVRIVNV